MRADIKRYCIAFQTATVKSEGRLRNIPKIKRLPWQRSEAKSLLTIGLTFAEIFSGIF